MRGRERRSGRRVREEAWEEAWEGGAGSGRGAAACLVLGELSEHREERHEDRAAADARGGGEHGRGEDGDATVDVLLPDGEEANLLHIVHELDRTGAEPGVA